MYVSFVTRSYQARYIVNQFYEFVRCLLRRIKWFFFLWYAFLFPELGKGILLYELNIQGITCLYI